MKGRSARTLSWEQALAWRMGRHRLVDRADPKDLVRVSGEICGLHAQLMSSTELSLWARIEGLERDAVENALWERRSLVKLWAMRGTLHLLPADDLGVWLAALGAYTRDGNTWPEMDVLADAVGRALDGRVLTREELAHEVERITREPTFGEWVRFSWGSYLKAISYRGLICFASSEDRHVRFTTPATWLGGDVDKPDAADALREITRSYLAAYAPATSDDLGRWWGVSATRATRMVEALGDEAVEVDVEGDSAWALARDVREMARVNSVGTARLLPAFDPWVVGGSRGLPAQIDPAYEARVFRAQGWISPVVLVDGRMVGVWRHAQKGGGRLLVEVETFRRLAKPTIAEVEAEAERLAGFLGRELVFRHPAKVASRRG